MDDSYYAWVFICCCVLPVVALIIFWAIVTRMKGKEPEREHEGGIKPADDSMKLEEALQMARLYTISLPKGSKWEPQRAEALMTHLLMQLPILTFLIVAEPGRIVWQILDMQLLVDPDQITGAVRSQYPEADVSVSRYTHSEFTRPFFRTVLLFRQSRKQEFEWPIKSVAELKHLDPLTSVVQGFSDLQPGERIVHLLHVHSHLSQQAIDAANERITIFDMPLKSKSVGEWLGRTTVQVAMKKRKPKYVPEDQKVVEEKLLLGTRYLFNAYLLTQLDLFSLDHTSRLSNLTSSISLFDSNYTGIEPIDISLKKTEKIASPDTACSTSAVGILSSWLAGTDERYKQARTGLSVQELAGLWHLPHDGFSANEIVWKPTGRVAAPAILTMNTRGVILGKNIIAGKQAPHPHARC